MKLLGTKIERPGLAFAVIVGVSALLAVYGEVRGACLLVSLFLGVAIYKALSA